MTFDAFFETTATDRFDPRPEARSPWSPHLLHGRLLAGLAARTVETHHLEAGLRPARLTIDLFRSPPLEPVHLRHAVLRDGGRIRVVEVIAAVGGLDVSRSSIVLLRAGTHPDGVVWNRDDWDVPHPDDMDEPTIPATRSIASTQIKAVDGRGMGWPGQRQVWLRDERTLVDGEPLTPFQRAALASDFASPLGNSSDLGLAFINADITLYLGRLPQGEWIGLEVGAHTGADGIAVTRCDMFDIDGPVGFTDVCAVANTRVGG